MKPKFLLPLILLFTTACGPSPQALATQTAEASTAIAVNWTATPTITLTPTATLTPSPTVDPSTIFPAEWANKIDHVETLADGRKVAIEKSTVEGKDPVKRVFQWDEGKKEWIAYIPVKSLFYNQKSADLGYNPETVLSKEIPEVKIPLIDAKGNQYPLGFVGYYKYGDTKVMVASGVVVDIRQSSVQINTIFWTLAIPLPNGDIQLAQFFAANGSPDKKSFWPYSVANKVDIATLGQSSNGPIPTTEETEMFRVSFWSVLGSPGTYRDEYNFLRDHADLAIGAQVGISIQDQLNYNGVDVSAQYVELMKIIEGINTKPPLRKNANSIASYSAIFLSPELYGWGGQ